MVFLILYSIFYLASKKDAENYICKMNKNGGGGEICSIQTVCVVNSDLKASKVDQDKAALYSLCKHVHAIYSNISRL